MICIDTVPSLSMESRYYRLKEHTAFSKTRVPPFFEGNFPFSKGNFPFHTKAIFDNFVIDKFIIIPL
jgi:hypothetical protein